MTNSKVQGPRRSVAWLSYVLLCAGLITRLAPLLNREERLLRQFPSEDGYLMLTLARNLALGHGLSTADGTIPSNGTQPLATFLWAAVFRLTGGDKITSLAWILCLQTALAALTTYLLFRLARRWLGQRAHAEQRALLAAAVWFGSPVILPHTVNYLETGLYAACLALSLLLIFREGNAGLDARKWLSVGVALGVAFWARNDVVLVCAALGTFHLVWGSPGAPPQRGRRFVQLGIAGGVMAVLAAPWLWFNYTRFGGIVPISGQSEALGAEFGAGLPKAVFTLLEYLGLLLPIPDAVERRPWALALASVVVAAALAHACARARRAGGMERAALLFGILLCLTFFGFYGLYFGASYFIPRYFVGIALLGCVLWANYVFDFLAWLHARDERTALNAAMATILVLCVGLHVRLYQNGPTRHEHFQVVAWVQRNVPKRTWVGAIQTGTLGYFHDRTINLDGKVNPYALQARKENRIPQYILQTNIAFLVDWLGIASWAHLPALSRTFLVRLTDPTLDLAVLERRKTENGGMAEAEAEGNF